MLAVIFEVWPAAGRAAEYFDLAAGLKKDLERIDGFISIERFQSLVTPDKFVSIQTRVSQTGEQFHRCLQSEPIVSACDGTQRLANHRRSFVGVLILRLVERGTGVASTTPLQRLGLVAEVAQNGVVPTRTPLSPAHEFQKERPAMLDARGVGRRSLGWHFQQAPSKREIRRAGAQHADSVGPVTPGPPDFLIVGLDRPRRCQMYDRSHIGTIDSHAKSVGRYDDLKLPVAKTLLGVLPHWSVEPGMVRRASPADAQQSRALIFCFRTRWCVDDGSSMRR